MTLVRYLLTIVTEGSISLKGTLSGPVALFALNDLTILFICSLEAGVKSKLKEYGKIFSFMIKALGWSL